jgi:hypothetical protein
VKERNMKKKTLFLIFGLVMGMLGCTLPSGSPTAQLPGDETGTVVPATLQALTVAPSESISTQASGTTVSFENVSFVIPSGLASEAAMETVPAVSEGGSAPWEVAPAHLKFTLTGYQLEGKFHEPQILVYPADEFAQVNSIAAEQIDRIKNILVGSPLLQETLPRVPWFNAEQLMAANIKTITFQSGSGVRALTQYAQYAEPINNRGSFYHFEGLTTDGKYYVITILPITAPILAEDEKPEASVPANGVPIPTDVGPNEVYYASVTEKLTALSPDEFTPSLTTLDTLIQSILVTNP